MRVLFLAFLFVFCCNINAQESFISEEVLVMNDSIKLPGTLTYNSNLDVQPLVIFINGSGNPDRNGNQPQLGVNGNYIQQFANTLTNREIAFFRFDKRNVTASNVPLMMKDYVFTDLVSDVEKIVDQFEDDKRFSSITLIGHSQGSLVAMLAINDHVDKFISLAGAGESIDNTIIRQIKSQSPILVEAVEAHIKELKSTGTIETVNPMLMSLFAKPNQQFLKSYMSFDPSKEIQKIKIPTLIVNGGKDIQVPVEDAKNLHNAKPDAELLIISNMNHVLKIIDKDEDNLSSYMSPDFPLSEELVTATETFVKQ